MPRANTWTASFPARLDTETEGMNGSNRLTSQGGVGRGAGSNGGSGAAAEGGGCSNPATDGVYVYVWHAGSKRVHKVGEKGDTTAVYRVCIGRSFIPARGVMIFALEN